MNFPPFIAKSQGVASEDSNGHHHFIGPSDLHLWLVVEPPNNENILEVSWRFIPGGNHTFHRAFRAQLDAPNHHGWTTKSGHHLVVLASESVNWQVPTQLQSADAPH